MADKIFRDAVHGDIQLQRDLEVLLMDTLEFQRLRGIKQLGTAYLVYPSAVHTRFEHSLGTAFLARRLLSNLEALHGRVADAHERRALFAAALLHDVSHIPFGHTFEDERHIFPRHDARERVHKFLRRGALGKALQKLGLRDAVESILVGDGQRPLLRDIVSGTICADLLDYLARDSMFCGLRAGYDERVFRCFRVHDDHLCLEAQKEGILREDVLSEIVNLLRLRYFLSERVYFHHSKTASGAMISRAVECAVNAGLTLEDLFDLTDDRLLMLLEYKYGTIAAVQTLMRHFLSHRLYKRAYVLTRRVGEERIQQLVSTYHHDRAAREATEQALIHKLRLKEGELIVYCPSARMSLKEADVRVRVDESSLCTLGDLSLPEIRVLQEKHRDLWKFYVFVAPHVSLKAAGTACENYFESPNHLPALQSGQLFLSVGV